MSKKKGKIERSIHYFDIDLQRIGNSDEDSFVSYKDQASKMLSVFRGLKKYNDKLEKEKIKVKDFNC